MENREKKIIDMGSIIRKELKRQGQSVEWLADQLSCDRTTAYRRLKKISLDSLLLHRISTILKTDFFAHYPSHGNNCGNSCNN